MKRTCIYSLTAVLMTITVLAPNAWSDAREEFHETYRVSPGVPVNIKNVNGNIEVRSWNSDVIEVHAEKKTNRSRDELDRAVIEVTIDDAVRIETIHDKKDCEDETFFQRLFGFFGSRGVRVTVNYTIKIPTSARLQSVRTTNGSVRVYETSGDAELSSTNGNIYVENAIGFINAHTTNGNIDIEGTSTVNSARTTNGSIRAALPDIIRNDIELKTTNGGITIAVSPDIDASLDMRTTNGSVNANGFTITMDKISSKHLTGKIGRGGNTIRAVTTNGGIKLNRK